MWHVWRGDKCIVDFVVKSIDGKPLGRILTYTEVIKLDLKGRTSGCVLD
jgi:hypothetical protein